jgi:DNA polymerase-3 subunit delta
VTAPAPLHLVLGEEELLIGRAVRAALDAARAADPTADLTRVGVSELTAPVLAEMVSPSLFSEGRVIVIEAAQDISQEVADAVLAYIAQPADGIVLVVVHTGGGRSKAAKALPAALRKAGAVITECPKMT